jgi:hypothetical protein
MRYKRHYCWFCGADLGEYYGRHEEICEEGDCRDKYLWQFGARDEAEARADWRDA